MKQVNLKELNIEELRFTLWTGLPDALLEKIRSLVTPDEDGDFMFRESYRVGNVGHSIFAIVKKSNGGGEYRIGFVCQKGGSKRSTKGYGSVSKLLETLLSIKEEVTALCVLNLSFGRRRKYKTIISLPIRITDMPKTIYDEIRGFHFMKHEDKTFKYDVILDLEPDGTLIEMINYRKVINIKESILEDVIQEGMGISNCFVLREK